MTLVNGGRIFTPFVGDDPTIVKPGVWGGANWPPSSYDPVQQTLFVCASSVAGVRRRRQPEGHSAAAGAALRGAAPRRRIHAARAHRDLRGRRHDDERARVAFPLARAVLQRVDRHRGRPGLRRPQRRPAHGARLENRHAALGVSDGRGDARGREHRRAQRPAVRARVFGGQRVDRLGARRQRVDVRPGRHAAAGRARRAVAGRRLRARCRRRLCGRGRGRRRPPTSRTASEYSRTPA